MNKYLIVAVLFITVNLTVIAQSDVGYHSQSALTTKLEALAAQHPDLVKLEVIATTFGDQPVYSLSIADDPDQPKPGLALVGGIDGGYLLGTELVLGFAESLLANLEQDSIRQLLQNVSFYLLPDVSPDASAQHFSSPRYERQLNARPTDNDRDGRLDEDPYEDLNGDGIITIMRIQDQSGEWITHPDDPRVMIKARPDQQEKGSWKVYTEGRDNDYDQKFNEDGPGGVAFNHNLPYDYQNFTASGGEHAVSEIESRAVLDYLYDRWNIFSVISFGPSDNLAEAMKGADEEGKTPIQWKVNDAKINQWISDSYKNTTSLKGKHKTQTFNGDFLQWAYYHYGRLSFGTPGWYIPKIESKGKEGEPGKEKFHFEVNALRYADSTGWQEVFLEWEPVDHPDYPDQLVEVGGIKPFFPENPPADAIDSLTNQHNRFIYDVAQQHPQARLINLKTTQLDNQLTRVKVEFYNAGNFPALAEIAKANKWLKKPVVRLHLEEGQSLISGRKVLLLDNLEGDTAESMEWIIQGKGTVTIEAGAPQMGFDRMDVNL